MSQTAPASTEAPQVKPQPQPPSRASQFAQFAIGALVVAYIVFTRPEFARTTAIFLVVLGVLVFVHEWGHFQFARWAGMKVNRFAIGFPPFIYTKRRNNIDYSIGALPIGGMVDIAGLGSEEEMVAESRAKVDQLLEKSNIGEQADHQKARAQIYRDTSRPFGQKQFQDGSLFWRFMVLFAGPLMNFIFAIIVFVSVYSIVGVPDAIYKARIDTVMAGQAAQKAGLKDGDEIVAIGGKAMSGPEAVTDAIHSNGTKPTTISVLRGEQKQKLTLPLTPVVTDIHQDGKPVASIGIAWDLNAIRSISYQKVEPLTAVKLGFLESAGVSLSILDTIKRALTRQLSSQEVKSIRGPVGIAQTVGQASEFGSAVLFRFAALLSVNLGLMNLLPLPALDGGRIMFLGYELVARRPFNPRWEGIVHAAGMVMLLGFMIFITLRDVNAGAFFKNLIN